ncbi:hypothetical protein [Streptomyces sp. NPDC092129]|uniref:hypothetical protein n=1 Tax=Streptomyces sp. NPDC092129 TaxID=3366010 RepID=UPI00382F7442
MSAFSPSRRRRIAAAASILTVVTVVAGALALAAAPSVPVVWWPRIGHVFPTPNPTRHAQTCAREARPATTSCTHRANPAPTAGHGADSATASKLRPAATGTAACGVGQPRRVGRGRC